VQILERFLERMDDSLNMVDDVEQGLAQYCGAHNIDKVRGCRRSGERLACRGVGVRSALTAAMVGMRRCRVSRRWSSWSLGP
jgi:hypothetical protein